MRELFDFLEPKGQLSYKIMIGSKLKEFIKIETGNKYIDTVEVLNSIDRVAIANNILNYGEHYGIDVNLYTSTRKFTRDELLEDVSAYVDLILPRRYCVNLAYLRGEITSKTRKNELYKGIDQLEGAKFHYEDNYERDRVVVDKRNAIFTGPNYVKEGKFRHYSNTKIYNTLKIVAYNSGYKLIVSEEEINKVEMIKLLRYFYKGEKLTHITLEQFLKKRF